MTVQEFYVALGSNWTDASDWECREKIEKAVFSFKISWKQQVDDKVCEIIANTGKEEN